jgi:hypothetical protein
VNAPGSFLLSANATDSDGNIAKVEFLQGTTVMRCRYIDARVPG